MKLTREFYRPTPEKGYKQYQPEIGNYKKDLFEVWVNLEQPHNPKAMFFIGKQAKYAWWNKFNNVEEMKKKINEYISRLMSWEDMKVERRKARQNVAETVNVGDLFSCSWGYEQTNVDFYQLIEKRGKKMVFAQIGGKTVEGSTYSHGMADKVTAVKNAFLDKERYPNLEKLTLNMPFGYLHKTTEQEQHYRSWYA